MIYQPKNKPFLLISGTVLGAIAILGGCGGGGGSSNPVIPSPFDASYNATYAPSTTVSTDTQSPDYAQAPSGTLNIIGGRGTLKTTFYLQPSVVTRVQNAINTGLNNAGYGYAVDDNQVPKTIAFTGSGLIDGNGKLVLTSKNSVDVCGTATLVVNQTFTNNGTTISGTGDYAITFPNNLTIEVKGRRGSVAGTCNNLPLRSGNVTFNK